MKDKKLMNFKDAMKYFTDRGYDKEELKQYTPLEIQILAGDQKARENGK